MVDVDGGSLSGGRIVDDDKLNGGCRWWKIELWT